MTLEELNTICMQMISYAGEGRSIVYDAMSELLNNKYEEAEKILGEAHRLQFEDLMVAQSRSEDIPFSLLLLHAMDITLVSTSEHDLLRAMVNAKLNKS